MTRKKALDTVRKVSVFQVIAVVSPILAEVADEDWGKRAALGDAEEASRARSNSLDWLVTGTDFFDVNAWWQVLWHNDLLVDGKVPY